MSNLAKHVPFVNEQISFQAKMMAKFADNEYRKKLHSDTHKRLQDLLSDIIIADQDLERAILSKKVALAPSQLALSPEEIEGLPQELINELSISDGDKTDFIIVNLIEEAGGLLSLDRILIGVYKKTQEIIKRSVMTSRLYRMNQKGLVFSVPNKKGWYSTQELTDEDVNRIFGTK